MSPKVQGKLRNWIIEINKHSPNLEDYWASTSFASDGKFGDCCIISMLSE